MNLPRWTGTNDENIDRTAFRVGHTYQLWLCRTKIRKFSRISDELRSPGKSTKFGEKFATR